MLVFDLVFEEVIGVVPHKSGDNDDAVCGSR
jgi:hypothetical protein